MIHELDEINKKLILEEIKLVMAQKQKLNEYTLNNHINSIVITTDIVQRIILEGISIIHVDEGNRINTCGKSRLRQKHNKCGRYKSKYTSTTVCPINDDVKSCDINVSKVNDPFFL